MVGGCGYCLHLGMCRDVAQGFCAVVGACYYFASDRNHRSYRDFILVESLPCLVECHTHESFVALFLCFKKHGYGVGSAFMARLVVR